jgi:hypothetical protein
MEKEAILKSTGDTLSESLATTQWWHNQNGRGVCDLGPDPGVLKDGDDGFVFVRRGF